MAIASVIALSGCNETGFVAAPAGTLAQGSGDSNPTNPGTPGTPGNPVPNPMPSCQVSDTTKPVRIIFMLDNSGSTLTTDPDQVFRVQTIQKFNNDYGAKPNLSFNLGYFGLNVAYMFDMNLSKFVSPIATNPIGTSAQLSVALSSYDMVQPNGSTPYKAAFSTLESTVKADIAAGGKQDYAVVFMSDGQPTDVAAPVITNLNLLVNSLKAAAASSNSGSLLSLSSVYFGAANDTVSIDNLKSMATTGGGQFVDTNKLGSGGLVINNVISVPGECK